LLASGVIARSWAEQVFLSSGDRIYVTWPERSDLELGGIHVIYRPQRTITHPDGRVVGRLTQVVGTARVLRADPHDEYVTAQIVESTSEIERGDRVGPRIEALLRPITRRHNEVDLKGRIIATIDEDLVEVAQGHLVFLDRGVADGVVEGNVLQ